MAQCRSKVVLQPVQGKKASEELYHQIRTMILGGEIQPGERLPSERKMMAMVERSRPTIREAMRMLERDGYIKTIPGSSGAVVLESNVDNAVQSIEAIVQMQRISMNDIYEFRMVDETMAAKYAAERRTQQDIDHLKQNIVDMKAQAEVLRKYAQLADGAFENTEDKRKITAQECESAEKSHGNTVQEQENTEVKQKNTKKEQTASSENTASREQVKLQYLQAIETFSELDVQFHTLLAVAAGNEMFSIVQQVCRNVLGRSLVQHISSKPANELMDTLYGIQEVHKKVVESIIAQDVEAAQKHMQEHLLDAGEDMCYNK